MKQTAFLRTAQKIQEWLRANPDSSPPSIRDASVQYHVSYRTAWKAFQHLARKGVVASRPGASMMRVVHGHAMGAPSKADSVHAYIRVRILDGTYPAGKPFPKIDYFVARERASRPTVSQTLYRLAREGLAHRVKSRWVAGPAPRISLSGDVSAGADAPVVLFLAQHARALSEFFGEPFTSRFFLPFCNEIAGHGIQAMPAVRGKSPGEVVTIPVGVEEVKARIRALKGRYCGTLISCIFPESEKITEWICALAEFDKPVIWFDYAGVGETCTRSRLATGKRYFRMYLDEGAALRCALDALVRRGHRTIAIHGADQFDWATRRARFLEMLAASLPAPGARVVIATDPAEAHWQFVRHDNIHEIIASTGVSSESWDGDAASEPSSLARSLIEKTPSIVNLLRDHAPTALVALNDNMAREYYYWCSALGIRIPGDLSIVSFDNLPAATFFPISTIDWGFERLGYQAAHIMIGDLPIRANREGGIAGPCTLIQRGSVDRPGDSGRVLRQLCP